MIKKKIFNFRLSSTNKIEFKYSEVQYKFIQDQLDRFPDNIVGASKALFGGVEIPAHHFWRKASLQNNLEN